MNTTSTKKKVIIAALALVAVGAALVAFDTYQTIMGPSRETDQLLRELEQLNDKIDNAK
jgi:hypothetical protein